MGDPADWKTSRESYRRRYLSWARLLFCAVAYLNVGGCGADTPEANSISYRDVGSPELAGAIDDAFGVNSREGSTASRDGSTASREGSPLPKPVVVATVDLRIEGAEPTPFGEIHGIALDNDNRLLVLDGQAHRLHVIADDGTTVLSFGARGSGPGEFATPWGPFVSSNNVVWILSSGERRLDAIVLDSASARAVHRLRIPDGIPFLPEVRILDDQRVFIRAHRTGVSYAMPPMYVSWIELDTTGMVIEEYRIPQSPYDSLDLIIAYNQSGGRGSYLPPFAAIDLTVFDYDGSYARALTSRYEVVHYDLDGSVRHRIKRDLLGEKVTSDDMDRERVPRLMEMLDYQRRRIRERGGSMPVAQVPETKPVIREMWFDREGRLWVRLWAISQGMDQADVYDSKGEFAFTAKWPASIRLAGSAIDGVHAWGIEVDSLGVQSVVRLMFE